MGVGLSGSGIEYHRDLADKGVCEEAAGKNHGICIKKTNIKTLYSHIEYGGMK